MIQKIFVSRAFFGICIVLILTNLGGCYSSLPIEFSKISGKKDISKIKLKDKTEYYFENEENQILSVDKTVIVLIDQSGSKREISISDIDTFYTFTFDPIKLVFGSLWIGFAVMCLLWLGSTLGPVG